MIVKVDRNPFKIKSTGKRNYAVTGDLTIRGVTKSVTLTVEDVSKPSNDSWEHYRIGLSDFGKVNRKYFGLMWNSRWSPAERWWATKGDVAVPLYLLLSGCVEIEV